jgi:ligand-binding sensor domain-containing protein
MVKLERIIIWLALSALLLTGCKANSPEQASVTPSLGPTQDPRPNSTPFPTTVPGLTPLPAVSPTPVPPVSDIPSTTTAAMAIKPGWTRYTSINDVYDLSFAPDDTLWATTDGGLVHWDLTTSTYTRYLIDARDVAVAPDGTLWLATAHGLCHFTAGACRNYTRADGLMHDAVRAVAVTGDGVVWAGTETGVGHFNGSSWKSYPSPTPIENLALAADGAVWVATAAGVGRYNPSHDDWTTYAEADGLPDSHALLVATGPGGEVWTYILWYGVYEFDGEMWQAVGEIPGGTVADVAFAADGTPWVGTIGGTHYPGGVLVYRQGETWADVTTAQGLMSIRAVAPGPAGTIAASTNLGLGIYQGDEWRLLKDGPTSDRVTSVAVTPDGATWFAFGDRSVTTPGGGLSRFDGQEWEYFLGDSEVNALAVAPDGSLWAGMDTGVVRFDGHDWDVVAECQSFTDCGVLDIAFTTDGATWVANSFSVARLADLSGTAGDGQSWTRYEKLVSALVAAPDGGIWMNGWEGSQGSNYVAHYDGANWTTYRSADAFPGRFAVGAATDDGRVWGIVPGKGLASFTYPIGGSGAGSAWTDSQAWTFYTPPEGVSLLSVVTVAPDGALWLTTEDGVARFDPAAGLTGDDAPDPGLAWTIYTSEDGLINYYHAIAFGPDGEMWFGTTRFQPAEAAVPPTPAPLSPW